MRRPKIGKARGPAIQGPQTCRVRSRSIFQRATAAQLRGLNSLKKKFKKKLKNTVLLGQAISIPEQQDQETYLERGQDSISKDVIFPTMAMMHGPGSPHKSDPSIRDPDTPDAQSSAPQE